MYVKTDGLLPSVTHSDELSLQHKRKSSYNAQRTSPSLYFKADGFLLSALTSGFSLQYRQTKLPTSTETGPSLYFKQIGSSLLFSLTRPQGQHPQIKPCWPEQNDLQKSGRCRLDSCDPRFRLRDSERKAEIFQNIIKNFPKIKCPLKGS